MARCGRTTTRSRRWARTVWRRAGSLSIMDGMFDSAVDLHGGSLPELFCGFAREARLGPVPYPVACHPQAWAAASVFLMLQATLGLKVMGFQKRVVLDSPAMPRWLEWLRIDDLKVGDDAVSFILRRAPDGAVTIEILENRGSISVEIS